VVLVLPLVGENDVRTGGAGLMLSFPCGVERANGLATALSSPPEIAVKESETYPPSSNALSSTLIKNN
jgi:hypothetical protein